MLQSFHFEGLLNSVLSMQMGTLGRAPWGFHKIWLLADQYSPLGLVDWLLGFACVCLGLSDNGPQRTENEKNASRVLYTAFNVFQFLPPANSFSLIFFLLFLSQGLTMWL